MKVVFLDIDGVLRRTIGDDWLRRPFEPEAVIALNSVLTTSGAKIVLATAWRIGLTIEQLETQLTAAGVLPGQIVGKTPFLHDGVVEEIPGAPGHFYYPNARPRHEEIRAWLNEHPEVTRWAAIDDDPRAGPEGLFLTESTVGLTAAIAARVIAHLAD